jgi:hypothetical protein
MGRQTASPKGALRERAMVAAALLLTAGAYLGVSAGCSSSRVATGAGTGARASRTATSSVTPRAAVPVRPVPHLVVREPRGQSARWSAFARVRGQPAAWLAQRSGATLMRIDQRLVHLDLHAGSSDGGTGGWAYGDQISRREIHLVIAAVNGGFKLTYRDVGFVSGRRVAVALKTGLGSIVTYSDGTTDIGAWREGVPSARRTVFSVLQNQRLLIDRGMAAASVAECIIACWGETIGSRTVVARAGLGITTGGQLVWAAGEQLAPADLAAALKHAGAARAVELDINPAWVAGYLYLHRRSGPAAVPLVPGQVGIAGELLEPYSRDFLTLVAN